MPNLGLAESESQQAEIARIIESALAEDIGSGDLTTALLIPAGLEAKARIVAKQAGIVAGGPVVKLVLHQLDLTLDVKQVRPEGEWVGAGDAVMEITGRAQAILTAERLCLNFLGKLSGIATLTAQYVEAVKQWDVKILDTRKTIPGLRVLERYAVRVGGGENHRQGLFDQVLVKDNHLQLLEGLPKGTLVQKVKEFRKTHPGVLVEIEVDLLEQLDEILEAGPDIILLDNMDPDTLAEGVRRIGKRAVTEASGGITLANVAEVARTGVERISVGALTHSVNQINYSLDVLSRKEPQ